MNQDISEISENTSRSLWFWTSAGLPTLSICLKDSTTFPTNFQLSFQSINYFMKNIRCRHIIVIIASFLLNCVHFLQQIPTFFVCMQFTNYYLSSLNKNSSSLLLKLWSNCNTCAGLPTLYVLLSVKECWKSWSVFLPCRSLTFINLIK